MKRIAVLTSGGDAPGMNACIRAVIRTCIDLGIEPYVVYDGFKGLVEGEIKKVGRRFVSETINRGGTIIGTARLPEFDEEVNQLKAIENLKKYDLDGLVAIGGEGTLKGCLNLSKRGIKCVGIPGTIDNDINIDGYTIGFDTAINTIVQLLDKIRDTSSSHNRCSIVEVMGRDCGDLALYSGIACGADIIISKETHYDEQVIFKEIREMKKEGRRHVLVVVSENIIDVEKLKLNIERETKFQTRTSVLGHLQRGGIPSAMDRFSGSLLGVEAVKMLLNKEDGMITYLKGNKIKKISLQQAIQIKKSDNKYMYEYAKKIG